MRERADGEPKSRSDDTSAQQSKRATLIESISKRLRPVCSRMPATEFDAMVQQMAEIELKYGDQTVLPRLDRAD